MPRGKPRPEPAEEIAKMTQEHDIGTSGADETASVPEQVPDTFSIGELINERYLVVSRVSEGTTGKLYRTRDMKTESETMLELLVGWPRLDDELIRQLSADLALTRTLRGPQSKIAVVHGCELTPDGRAFVVMEPLEGRRLAELIQWREPLSVERALCLAIQIAEGLHAAHNVRLVHGALDAEHVLVQQDDTVKLMGFEVARLRALTQVASRSEIFSAAADTKAVAMLLLEMLTNGVRSGPQGDAPDHKAPRGGQVPPPVKELVMQCLVRSPGLPPYDMEALAKALTAELERPPENPSTRAWRRARPRKRPNLRPLVGAGLLAAVVSALGGWLTWSLVAAHRTPVTHEVATRPTPQVSVDSGSSEAATATPVRSSEPVVGSQLNLPPNPLAEPLAPEPRAPTSVPSTADVGTPQPRVKRPQGDLPAIAQPPAAAERASARPRDGARPVRGSSPERSESDVLDPGAIIDWLIKKRGSESESERP
jgi:eukaryotic-like serine/threonine-protein kinase